MTIKAAEYIPPDETGVIRDYYGHTARVKEEWPSCRPVSFRVKGLDGIVIIAVEGWDDE